MEKKKLSVKDDKKFWYNPWTVGIGTLIIGTILFNWLTDWGKVLIDYSVRIFFYLINIITITIPIPIWGVLIILFVFWLLAKKRFKTFLEEEAQSKTVPAFYNYKSDIFGDVLYRWIYEKDYQGKLNITGIIPFCPQDNCQLRWGSCPICCNGYILKDEDELQILIRHKIQNGLYKQS